MSVQQMLNFDAVETAEETPAPVQQPEKVEERKPRGNYTLENHKRFCERMASGEMDAATLKETFAHAVASKEKFITGLVARKSAKQLQNLAARLGCFRVRSNGKTENAWHVFRTLLFDFTLERSAVFSPLSGETFEDAIGRQVSEVTDEALGQYFRERAEATAKRSSVVIPRWSHPRSREMLPLVG